MRGQSGQGTVEYILILSATVTGALLLTRGILSVVDQGLLRMGAQMEQDLKTGRVPARVWEN